MLQGSRCERIDLKAAQESAQKAFICKESNTTELAFWALEPKGYSDSSLPDWASSYSYLIDWRLQEQMGVHSKRATKKGFRANPLGVHTWLDYTYTEIKKLAKREDAVICLE